MLTQTFSLTPHQETVKKAILTALMAGEKRLLLTGSAGVGKTTCINEIIDDFVDMGFRRRGYIEILAPTNKALQILVQKNSDEYWKKFSTVHQALNLKRYINEEKGEIEFHLKQGKTKEKSFKNADLVIIDEASMLNRDLLRYLNEYPHIPMIFVGDEKQLPPVHEEISPIFKTRMPRFELTEVVRQEKGNPIIALSQNLEHLQFREPETNSEGGYDFVKSLDWCVNTIARNADNVKFLAWTNKSINNVNSLVRRKRYGIDAKMIENGEILVMSAPYNKDYYTSQEVEVNDIKITERVYPITFTGKAAKGKSETLKLKIYLLNDELVVVHEESLNEYKKMLTKIKGFINKNIATWKDYYRFKEEFAHVDYNYASTVHKSQGSTYRHVIIDVNDIDKNLNSKEKKKLWYTAITRASKTINFLI